MPTSFVRMSSYYQYCRSFASDTRFRAAPKKGQKRSERSGLHRSVPLAEKLYDLLRCASPAAHFDKCQNAITRKSLRDRLFRAAGYRTRGGPCPLELPCGSVVGMITEREGNKSERSGLHRSVPILYKVRGKKEKNEKDSFVFTLIKYQQVISKIRMIVFQNCKIRIKITAKRLLFRDSVGAEGNLT